MIEDDARRMGRPSRRDHIPLSECHRGHFCDEGRFCLPEDTGSNGVAQWPRDKVSSLKRVEQFLRMKRKRGEWRRLLIHVR